MLTINQALVLQQLAIFADANRVNKSEMARVLGISRTAVIDIINKFKECEINVRKS